MITLRTRGPRTSAATGFGALWLGESASLLGNATSALLVPVLALVELDAGPLWIGLLTAAAWLPWVLVGLLAGAIIDRHAAKPVIVTANLAAAAALVTVPIAGWMDALTIGHLLVVALATGTASVFSRTAGIKIVPLVVDPDRLESANARLLGTESFAQVAGPGLGGLVVSVVSASTGLLVDVVGFVVSVLCMRRVHPRSPAARPDSGVHLRRQIGEGVAFVRHDRFLGPIVVIGSLSNFGLTGVTTLLVVFLVDDLGVSASYAGLVMMLGSLGGVAGALLAVPVAQRLGTGRASTALLVLSGPAALLIAVPVDRSQVWIVVAGLMLVGACVVSGNVVRGAWRQRYVPDRILGRVMTTSQVVNFGAMPLAGVAAGVLAHTLGTRTTLALMATVHLLATLAVLATPVGRVAELPQRADPLLSS